MLRLFVWILLELSCSNSSPELVISCYQITVLKLVCKSVPEHVKSVNICKLALNVLANQHCFLILFLLVYTYIVVLEVSALGEICLNY